MWKMDTKALQTELMELSKKLDSRIREVKFCLIFRQLKREENRGNSYVSWFFQSEAEESLKEAIERLYSIDFELFMLLEELRAEKPNPVTCRIYKKYLPLINDLRLKAYRLLSKVS